MWPICAWPTSISIPYGSIKRQSLGNHYEAEYYISIPYGSIKSIAISNIDDIVVDISIPYGSIKSYNYINNTFLTNAFQFLMVRLKADAGASIAVRHVHFNSLWFD